MSDSVRVVLTALGVALVGALARELVGRAWPRKGREVSKPSEDRGGASRGPIDRDLGSLVPSMRAPLRRVLLRMKARGFEPRVWETGRSESRAKWLTQRGTGILMSMHRLGLAADIVEDDNSPWHASPEFWSALHEEATREGFVVPLPSRDKPHLQAVEVREQRKAWAHEADSGALDALADASMSRRRKVVPNA